ncbi:MAG: SEC-C domain-containing protein [Planctomycetota bacterium]
MRIVYIVSNVLFAFGIIIGILFFSWVLSLILGWLFDFNSFQTFVIAMMTLGLFVIFTSEILQANKNPYHWLDDDTDAIALNNDDLLESQDPDNWFQPCPCGSEKLFARCCGKKAFRKQKRTDEKICD